jgi:hypothetical protein
MELVSYSRTRLQRHRFMRHFVYSVRYTAMPVNESLLTITLYSSFITTQNIQSYHDVITEFDCILRTCV